MKSKSMIKLIAFDKNHNLQYEGNCKISINKVCKMVLVEPFNEDYKMISAMFKWNFVIDKNIMFVFAENELSDFVLIFDDEIRCKMVYDIICKDTTSINVEKEMFFQRVWNPLCTKLAKNDDKSEELKNIIKNFIDQQEIREKEEFIKFLKEKNIFDIVYTSAAAITENVMDNKAKKIINPRKRRHSQINLVHKSLNDVNKRTGIKKQNDIKKIVCPLFYKHVNVKKGNSYHRRLLIFTTSEKTTCHEYSLKEKLVYYCNGCKARRKTVVAIIADENDCVKMEDSKHSCSPIPYHPEKYIEIKIIKKPEYEILENCNTHTGKLLIIFDQSTAKNKQYCWEFREVDHGSRFICRDCNTCAKIWSKGSTENEYIELRNVKHECKSRQYDIKNYFQFNDFILKPDYELQIFTSSKTGEEKKRLIIFDKSDDALCYIYSYARKNDLFVCRGCLVKSVRVSAKLLKNSEGEEYVLLSKKQHLCQGQPRSKSILKKEIILQPPPDFALMDNTSSGRKKLFIFDSSNQNLCYTFTQQNRHQNIYYCIRCRIAKNENNEIGKYLTIELCKYETGESFLRTNDLNHICKPKKYQPARYEKKEIQKSFDYFFFRPQKRPNSIFVGIYHPEDRSLCYVITQWKYISSFQCGACRRKDSHWTIKMEIDEDGKEYFYHDYKKHVCEPIKVSTIIAPKHVFLKRTDLVLAVKRKDNTTDEDKIIKVPNFVLAPNNNDIPDASLFVFHSESGKEENLGYRYLFEKHRNAYKCCGKLCYALAKLHVNKSGEKCIILGKAHHRCDPIKYEKFAKRDDQFITDSDFIKICANGKDRITTIIVFTTPARDECYEFAVAKEVDMFRCLGCLTYHKYFTVKLCKDEYDQRYFLKFMKPDENHVCIPRKYNKEKYEIKKQSYNFELMPNTKGEPNKKLIFFTSEKREFYYTFNSTSGRSYRCEGCKSKKKCVMAKVCEDKNGQKYVEYGSREHDCQPKRYNATKK